MACIMWCDWCQKEPVGQCEEWKPIGHGRLCVGCAKEVLKKWLPWWVKKSLQDFVKRSEAAAAAQSAPAKEE